MRYLRKQLNTRPDLAIQVRTLLRHSLHELHLESLLADHGFAPRAAFLNELSERVRARLRVITDATGHVEEVRGLAVVGHQPLIPPGEKFEYTSWTRLNTPHGHMHGTFFCMTDDARWFDAPIPAFTLARAHSLH